VSPRGALSAAVALGALLVLSCGNDDDGRGQPAASSERAPVEKVTAVSGSMTPTIETDQEVSLVGVPDELERGDVILFGQPGRGEFIARIVGLPGEDVEAADGTIIGNGQPVDEPWLPQGVETPDFGPVALGDDEYLVHGDNRRNFMPLTVKLADISGLIDCGESKTDC
jgi:signal peptidase I